MKKTTKTKNERPVRIIFTAVQRTEGDTAEISEVIDGVRTEEDGHTVLRFDERWEGVEEDVHSTLTVDGEIVTVERTGPVHTVMEFQPESDTLCAYETVMGSLSFVITTLAMELSLSDEAITLFVRYEMYAQGSLISENELHIEAK